MRLYKPFNTYKRLDTYEMYLELFFIFSLFFAISYFLPLFIALRTNAGQHISFLMDFLDSHKIGKYYPAIAGVALAVTISYGWLQSKDRRVIEIEERHNEVVVRSLNRYTFRIHEHVVPKDKLVAKQVKIGKWLSKSYKIYSQNQYVASFCPFASPWDRQRDRATIDKLTACLSQYAV